MSTGLNTIIFMANLFQSLVSFIRPKVNIQLNAETFLVGNNRPVYPDPNSVNFIKLGFTGNGAIYTIVANAARKFGYLPRYVYEIENEASQKSYRRALKFNPTNKKLIQGLLKKAYGETEVNNEFDQLIKNPNPSQGQDAFYALIYVYYLICGEAFIWINRGDVRGLEDDAILKMKPIEMWVLPSQYMIINADPLDAYGVNSYTLRAQGPDIIFPSASIIHWRKPNPNYDQTTRVHMRGLSPLLPGNKWVTQETAATDAQVAIHQNGGAKGALYNETLDNLSAEQKSQLQDVITRKVNNNDISGAVATLQGKWGYLDFSSTSQEMQLDESQKSVFVKLCNLFGIPPEIFISDNTYENKDQAWRGLVTNMLLPDSCSLRDEMNRQLLPGFGYTEQQFTHDVDITDLPELQEDMGKKVASLAQAWWLTPNQKLEQMNEERSIDPMMDKVWVPNNIILMDDIAMQDELNSLQNPTGSGTNLPNPQKVGPGKGN